MASPDQDPGSGAPPPGPPEGWRPQPPDAEHSWGNVSEGHWSRKRRDANQEAIEHYRRRSQAPGVAEGGGARNHYCPECKGVLPFTDVPPEHCPHCGAKVEERVREMFNWVEIDEPPPGDLGVLLPVALVGVLVLGGIAVAVWVALR